MEWLIDLIGPGHTELASTLVLYSFVIAAGIFLGKLKIGGISLGVTFVLFVGIIMGHFGYIVNPEVLNSYVNSASSSSSSPSASR